MTIADDFLKRFADSCNMTPGEYTANYYVETVDPEQLMHGYIFTDGSCLDICEEDHRSIPAKEWPENQIATFSVHSGDITLRIHEGVTIQQMEALMNTVERPVWYVSYYGLRVKEYRAWNKPDLYDILNKHYKGV